MLDAICLLGMIAFFTLVIYTTVVRAPDKPPAITTSVASIPPSPVGLFCSICGTPSLTVNHEEYMRISRAGTSVYCEGCMMTIEAYKRQQAGSRTV